MRISGIPSRYFSSGRRPSVAASRTQKWLRWASSSQIAITHWTTIASAAAIGDHPGHEVHALEHHRPALGQRAVDRGLDADEHVPRLVEEPEQPRSPASSSSAFVSASPVSKLE